MLKEFFIPVILNFIYWSLGSAFIVYVVIFSWYSGLRSYSFTPAIKISFHKTIQAVISFLTYISFHSFLRKFTFFVILASYLATFQNTMQMVQPILLTSFIAGLITPTYVFFYHKIVTKETLELILNKSRSWTGVAVVISICVSITAIVSDHFSQIIPFINKHISNFSLNVTSILIVICIFFIFSFFFDACTYFWTEFYLNIINQKKYTK